jgi:hypothetical protein
LAEKDHRDDMTTAKLTSRLFWTIEVIVLVSAVGGAAWLSRSAEWHPASLVLLLLGLALAGQWFSVKTSGGELSASLVALVLAMSLLGPAPAVALGVTAMVLKSAMSTTRATSTRRRASRSG